MNFGVRLFVIVVLSALLLLGIPVSTYAAPPLADPVTYTVQSGDTLFALATRFKTTVAEIKKLNRLGDNDTLVVGQKLLIPTSDNLVSPVPTITNTLSYTIQPGDTLARIALRYGVSTRVLAELNDMPNPNLLAEGYAIAIPRDAAVVKPGVLIDPVNAQQGDTVLVTIERPEINQVSGLLNGKSLKFTRAGGFFYALLGISRCAKIGNTTLATVTTAYPVNQITLPPSGVSILQNQALVTREAQELNALVNQYTPTRLWRGAFRQPVYTTITENFGTRRSYNGGPVGACGHEGTDFRMAMGDPVYAPARGKVVFAALTQVRGNLIVLDHGIGVFSAYYHLSEINTQVGQMVNPGMLIGKGGSTGLSTGPHLHWSMWVNGEYVDPMEWTRRVIP